jgi:hypothetical protein
MFIIFFFSYHKFYNLMNFRVNDNDEYFHEIEIHGSIPCACGLSHLLSQKDAQCWKIIERKVSRHSLHF